MASFSAHQDRRSKAGLLKPANTAGIGWPEVSDAIRRTMQANKGKDTRPELALRSMLHRVGYRFHVHGRGLPGTPDLVFSARRKVIWLHGCFWHQHEGCRFATLPKTRTDYWLPKFARNQERDTKHASRLRQMGWHSLVVWECEMRQPDVIGGRIFEFLGPPRHRQHCPKQSSNKVNPAEQSPATLEGQDK